MSKCKFCPRGATHKIMFAPNVNVDDGPEWLVCEPCGNAYVVGQLHGQEISDVDEIDCRIRTVSLNQKGGSDDTD